MSTGETLVFLAVIGARFLVPLLIPLVPLPAIIACLVLDAADQTIFQSMGYDPPGYQGYDKAMDVYYLAMAYMATLRNWASVAAFQVGRFLYFYRLVGVVAFELSHVRALLLVFPNTFEYYFIAYEVIRLRWDPIRFQLKFWVLVAGAIWIFVKLPQEWWIHIAQLDFTDMVRAHPWVGVLIAVAVVTLVAVMWLVILPRLDPAEREPVLTSDPLPEAIDDRTERAAWVARHGRLVSIVTAEKVMLVGLISVVFAQMLPGLLTSDVQLFIGLGSFVVINTALTLAAARAGRTTETLLAAFGTRLVVNVVLVLVAEIILATRPGDINRGAALFFVVMLSLITAMFDRFRPVHEVRVAERASGHLQPQV
jgi:hypothetical protein